MNTSEECPVRVAVRIRPQLGRERDDLCRLCVSSVPGEPQVLLGDDRSFTYDYLFDESHNQCSVYAKCVHDLVERCFEGFNATVLAYGQTGSGKTYTMGTGLDNGCRTEQGIIPRAVDQLYNSMEKRINEARSDDQTEPSFLLEAQFIEIYNDEVIDLLDTRQGEEKKRVSIHEDKEGNIHLRHVTTALVTTSEEALQILRIGALNRTTGYTLMNEQSSRSHAMFTLKLTIKRQNSLKDGHVSICSNFESVCPDSALFSKLNFVDLAGSERVKRTGATGQRAKEGICINSGLLALGNVISALGDRSLKATHVPYRDSKLTRLLQDSLGGNSRTLMIACVGPSDCDFIETLNTLKYANRARNIRNKVVVNQNRSPMLVSDLQLRLRQLEQELTEFRLGQRSADDFAYENQLYEENLLLANEVKTLNLKVRWLQDMVKTLQNGDVTAVSQEGANNRRSCAREIDGEVFSGRDDPTSMETQNRHVVTTCKPSFNIPYILTTAYVNREYINELMVDIAEGADLYGQRDSMTSSASDSSHAHLTELQNEIVERERELQRLKASHERLLNAKITYEARLEELSNRIRKTEMERDQAMSLIKKNYGIKAENGEREQALKREYEQKLGAMRAELRHLNSLKKENEKLLKEHSKDLSRIAALQSRLEEVKHAKRALLQQMKANAQEVLAAERHRAKQIRSLQRESLKKDMCIQSLRTEKERAAAILRQKQQEVSALRRRSRSALDLNRQKMANAVGGRDQDLLWRQVRAQLHECIAKREASIEVECDYDQLLEKRKSIYKSLAELKGKRHIREANNSVCCHADRTEDEIDCLETNLTYVEKCIRNCEQRIVSADEDNAVESKLYCLFDSCQSMRKAKALMKKLSSVTLLQAQVAASRRRKIDVLDAKVQQLSKEKKVLEQLLVHVVNDSSHSFPVLYGQAILKALSKDTSTESDVSESQQSQTSKARQRMTTAAQLLYPEDRMEALIEAPRNDCRTRECSPEPGCSFDLFNSDECYTTNDVIVDESNGEIVTVGWSLSRIGLVKPDYSPVRKVHTDGSSFLSLSHSGRLMLWDAETLTGFHIPTSDLTDPKDVKLNLNLNQLYVATRFGIAVRDTRTWQSAYVLSIINRMPVSEPSPQIPFIQVDCVSALPYVFGTTSKSLHVWDIRSLKEVANLCMAKCCFEDDVTKVYVVPSEKHRCTAILAGSQLVQLLEFDASKDCVSLNQSYELHYPMAGCVRALSAVESLIFAVIDDSLLCWDISSNLHNAQQKSHCYESKVSCMAPFQAAEGVCCWLVSADERGTLHSWVPSPIARMGRVQAHRDCINSLSSEGQLLFTASNDCTVALWRHINE